MEEIVKELSGKYNKNYLLINLLCVIMKKELNGKIDIDFLEKYLSKNSRLFPD